MANPEVFYNFPDKMAEENVIENLDNLLLQLGKSHILGAM